MLNYPVESDLLEPFVPAGTALDTYKGRAYLSIIAFLFLKTRLLGVPVPFHQDFEEVNLRFYVRRFAGDDWRRGVVFIKEIVPKPAIALVARTVYNENYISLPMRHTLETRLNGTAASVDYGWEFQGRWNSVRARTTGDFKEPALGSQEEFITEHYWGYTAQKDGGCVEYQIEHPRWRVAAATEVSFDCDAGKFYGEAFAPILSKTPSSAFLAEGSVVTVFKGVRI